MAVPVISPAPAFGLWICGGSFSKRAHDIRFAAIDMRERRSLCSSRSTFRNASNHRLVPAIRRRHLDDFRSRKFAGVFPIELLRDDAATRLPGQKGEDQNPGHAGSPLISIRSTGPPGMSSSKTPTTRRPVRQALVSRAQRPFFRRGPSSWK